MLPGPGDEHPGDLNMGFPMLTGPGNYEPGDLNIGFPMLTGPGVPRITKITQNHIPSVSRPSNWRDLM